MPEINEIDPIFSPFRTSKYPGFRSAGGPVAGGAADSAAPVPITASFRPRPDDDPREPNADRTGNPSTDRVSRRSAPPGRNPELERDLAIQRNIDDGLETAGGYALDGFTNAALSGLGLGPVKTAYDLGKRAYDAIAGSDDDSADPVADAPVGSTGGSIGDNNGGGSRSAGDRVGQRGNVAGAGSSGGPPGSPGNRGNGPGGSGPSGADRASRAGANDGPGGGSFHEGGYVAGDMDAMPREDVSATLQEQEFVLPADMVEAIGPTNLEALRRGLVDPAVVRQAILQAMQQQGPQADPMSLRG